MVNQQMCFYLLSRALDGIVNKLLKENLLPKLDIFGIATMICWGLVMLMFEEDRSVLQDRLQKSMNHLYKESDEIGSLIDF